MTWTDDLPPPVSLAEAIAAMRYYRRLVYGNPPREDALAGAERVLVEMQVRQNALKEALFGHV